VTRNAEPVVVFSTNSIFLTPGRHLLPSLPEISASAGFLFHNGFFVDIAPVIVSVLDRHVTVAKLLVRILNRIAAVPKCLVAVRNHPDAVLIPP